MATVAHFGAVVVVIVRSSSSLRSLWVSLRCKFRFLPSLHLPIVPSSLALNLPIVARSQDYPICIDSPSSLDVRLGDKPAKHSWTKLPTFPIDKVAKIDPKGEL